MINNRIILRLIVTFLLVGLGLTIIGCQTTPSDPASSSAQPSSAVEETPSAGEAEATAAVELNDEIKATQDWNIVFFIKDGINPKTGGFDNTFWQNMYDGAQQAGQDYGVPLQLMPNACDGCVEEQIRLVAELIAQEELDGIIITAAHTVSLVPVIEKAIEAGIPVIAVDNPLASDRLLTFVGFDNRRVSNVMGEWVVAELGGQGKVLLVYGRFDQQTALDRRDGLLQGLETGEIEILDSGHTENWEQGEAEEVVAGWLEQYPDVDAIIASNDTMALGIRDAVLNAGREDILIGGFDGITDVLEEIEAGRINATINQSPDQQARLAVQLMLRHLENGETFPPIVYLPEIPLVTKETVGQYLID